MSHRFDRISCLFGYGILHNKFIYIITITRSLCWNDYQRTDKGNLQYFETLFFGMLEKLANGHMRFLYIFHHIYIEYFAGPWYVSYLPYAEQNISDIVWSYKVSKSIGWNLYSTIHRKIFIYCPITTSNFCFSFPLQRWDIKWKSFPIVFEIMCKC